MITPQQIEQEHGIKRSTLYTYRHRPSFPQPVKVEGSIKTFYRADEVAAWLHANPKEQGKRTDLVTKEPDRGDPVTQTVDPRIAVLSSMTSPERSPDMVGMPWDDAVKELDAYRSKVLRLAAEAIEQEFLDGITDSERDQTWNAAIKAAATSLRQSAAKSEASGE